MNIDVASGRRYSNVLNKNKFIYRSRNRLIWCFSIIGNIVPPDFLVAERGFDIKSN